MEIARVVETDAPGLVVILANHASGVVRSRVGRARDPVRAVRPEVPLVLAHRGAALAVAVLPEAVGLVELGPSEGSRREPRRSKEQKQSLRAEASQRVLGGETTAREPELVVGAPRDAVVALVRIERTFQHAQAGDKLG